MDGELILIQWTIPVYLPQPVLLRAVTLRCKRWAGVSGDGGAGRQEPRPVELMIQNAGFWKMAAPKGEVLVCVIQLHPSGKFSLKSWCPGGDCIFFVQQETATWRLMVPLECMEMLTKCCQILKWRRFYLNKMDFLLHLKNHIGYHWTCNLTLDENRGVSAPLAQFHLTHLPALVL